MRKINKQFKKVLISTVLCNVLVWYDYALYGALLEVIKDNFFPLESGANQLMAVFGTFAVGFIMRPVGALFFGNMGDKYGRKKALLVSVITMSLPVLLIAIIPSYGVIGIMAPVLLIGIRMLQGFSLGGEAGNAVFLLEYSPVKIRGLISSFEVLSAIIGALLANIIVKVLKYTMNEELFFTYGWRYAFAIGALLGILGTILRYRTEESPLFIEKMKSNKTLQSPISTLFKEYKKKIFLAIGIDSVEEATLYIFLVFFASYVSKEIIEQPLMQVMQMALLVVLGFLTLFFAHVSDVIQSRKKVLMFAAALLLFAGYPMFWMFGQDTLLPIIIGEVILITIIGSSLGPTSAMMIEMFPAEVRYTAFSLSRNISSTIFGGFAPTICLFLINITDNKAAASFYFILIALIGIISLICTKTARIKSLS